MEANFRLAVICLQVSPELSACPVLAQSEMLLGRISEVSDQEELQVSVPC